MRRRRWIRRDRWRRCSARRTTSCTWRLPMLRGNCRRSWRVWTSRPSMRSTRFCRTRRRSHRHQGRAPRSAGGDEIFGGYPSFTRLPRAIAAKQLAGPVVACRRTAGRRASCRRSSGRGGRHFASTNGSLVEAYRVQRGFFPRQQGGWRLSQAQPCGARVSIWRDAVAEVQDVECALLSPAASRSAAGRRGPAREPFVSGRAAAARPRTSCRWPTASKSACLSSIRHLVERVWPELARHPDLMAGKRLLSGTLERPLPAAVVAHPKQGFPRCPSAAGCTASSGPFVQDGMRRLSGAGWIAAEAPDLVWAAWQRGDAHWSRPWGLERPWTLSESVIRAGTCRRSGTSRLLRRGDGTRPLGSPHRQRLDSRDRPAACWRMSVPPGPVVDAGCGEQPFRALIEANARQYVGMDAVKNCWPVGRRPGRSRERAGRGTAVSVRAVHRGARARCRHRSIVRRIAPAHGPRRPRGADRALSVSRAHGAVRTSGD